MKEKLRNPKIIKKQSYVFTHDGCRDCIRNNECIRCSMLNQPERKILLNLLGYKEKPKQAVLDGTKKHEEYFSEVKTLEEYGLRNFWKDLYSGKKIELKELQICNPAFALRGHIDFFSIQLIENTYNIEIIELKPKFSKSYVLQLAAYSTITGHPACKIIYEKKVRKVHHIPVNLYAKKIFNVNINSKFIYYKTNTQFAYQAIYDNQKAKVLQCILKKMSSIRTIMKASINYLSHFKKCDWCSFVECDFQDICDRFPYNPKEKQSYFGQKKLLVLSKRKIL